jgi:hypothetical protein
VSKGIDTAAIEAAIVKLEEIAAEQRGRDPGETSLLGDALDAIVLALREVVSAIAGN